VELGSPVFDKATILLGNNRKLVIIGKNTSKANMYVQGGVLIFAMGDRPNKTWGVRVSPPSVQKKDKLFSII